ncbi:DNA polymerase III subunit delta [Geomobilimonas luticola]|uniref:DNA polymerase III subunit delta n=1 Tax=Geomobilimonas luticola TaxID=1114878 RepID=A0ABS5SFN7_9BACT|nr:DNA polymerase III subunit delta [Geomobilimonas luticola]MBT0654165.1 DNA polymerase III subunit delta [Geomobilimonas luticola]
MKPDEFSRSLDKGEIAPLYYLYGDEPFLVERAVKRLLERVVDPAFRDFNLTVLYGNECKGAEIVENAQTLPMFAERRVVLVKRAQDLPAVAQDILTGYVQNPSPSTCLILQGEKIDQRKKLSVELKKHGALVEFKRPYENQLAPFVREEAAQHGKRVEPAAAEFLVCLTGANLQELSMQLDKVATYVGDRPAISLADVKAVVSDTRVDSVFELTDALGGKNLERALRNLHTILRDGEEPIRLLGMVSRHFRQLWKVRELVERKTPQQEIGRLTGINPYFLKGILEQARNFPVKELRDIFGLLLETDLALKSSGGKPAMLMERLVLQVCMAHGVPKREARRAAGR